MSAEDLAEHLRRLRVRAGDPSVRELERLTEQQGSRRRLSSSTIHDKLNGKSPMRLAQLMALVQACADYARGVGIVLPRDEIDGELWRKRLESTPMPARLALKPSTLPFAQAPTPSLLEKPDFNSPKSQSSLLPWSVEPLRSAGMDDVVELVESNVDQPMAEWLPQVLSALAIAGMSYMPFLKWASGQPVRELVALVEAIGSDKEDQVLANLLFQASRNQEAEKLPSLIVALRRASEDYFDGHELAQRVISFISGKGSGWHVGGLRKDCVSVVNAFRNATLMNDSNRIVREIGQYRSSMVIPVVDEFGGPGTRDGDVVLRAVAQGRDYHLVAVLRQLRDSRFSTEIGRQYLMCIVLGVSPEKRVATADMLEAQGLQAEAQLFREMKDAPPF